MEKLFENLLSNQTFADILVLGVGFILFFLFFRKEIRHEIKAEIATVTAKIDSVKSELTAKIDSVKSELKAEIKAEIAPVKSALENHITDTNKKIDRLSDRFDRLYEMLLKDKDKK